MPIRFTCPHCGTDTDVAESYAGQSGPCTSCGQTVTVPPLPGTPGYTGKSKGAYAGVVVVVFVVAGVVMFLVCGGAFFFAVSWPMARMVPPTMVTTATAVRSSTCTGNLRQIGLAMHNYHDAHGCFPPAYLADEDGQPMHSWRVLLLPYMDQDRLYDQYDFDEPWDSEHNLAVAESVPEVYRCPDDLDGDARDTSYLMIVGEETISDGPTAHSIADIQAGESNTIMVVESSRSGVLWTQPLDLRADEISFAIDDGTDKGVRSEHGGGAHVLFCDGSVRFIAADTDPREIETQSTITGAF